MLKAILDSYGCPCLAAALAPIFAASQGGPSPVFRVPARGYEARPDSERRPRVTTSPERPGSLQYHALSFAGITEGEGTGVLARLLARAEPYPQ